LRRSTASRMVGGDRRLRLGEGFEGRGFEAWRQLPALERDLRSLLLFDGKTGLQSRALPWMGARPRSMGRSTSRQPGVLDPAPAPPWRLPSDRRFASRPGPRPPGLPICPRAVFFSSTFPSITRNQSRGSCPPGAHPELCFALGSGDPPIPRRPSDSESSTWWPDLGPRRQARSNSIGPMPHAATLYPASHRGDRRCEGVQCEGCSERSNPPDLRMLPV